MVNTLLFPTDGREGAAAAFEHVLDLAAAHDAKLHILNVADTTHDSVTRLDGEVIDVLEREGKQIVQETADRAADRGITTVTDVLQGHVAERIVSYAETYDIDVVAMATRGRTGLRRLFLGSDTEAVVRRATVPVLAINPDQDTIRYPYEHVLVPTDGSACADAALDRALGIAERTGATVHLLSAVDVRGLGIDFAGQSQVDVLREQAEGTVATAAERLEERTDLSVRTAVEVGPPVHRSIQTYIDDGDIDLVVMGTHGRTGVERYLLGSTTEKTLRTATVPVMTVPDLRAEE